MHCFDLPVATPAEYLAWDDAFLDEVDEGGGEILWFWESPVPFVVVGYGQQVAREVHVSQCAERGIPILRRCSGGGAVVQGPGCLNYGLALRLGEGGALSTISGANQFILSRVVRALSPLLGGAVSVEGHTDLVRRGPDDVVRKFSGNAQRRKRHALLFHGTVLLDMDLSQITALLPPPSSEPAYRGKRPHDGFVINTGLSREAVRAALAQEWEANEPLPRWPTGRQQKALEERYRRAEWHGLR